MTYNVFSGTLSPTQSINQSITAVLNGTFYQPADTLDQVSLVLTMVSEYWLNEQEQRVRE